jgi:hypothetical protein
MKLIMENWKKFITEGAYSWPGWVEKPIPSPQSAPDEATMARAVNPSVGDRVSAAVNAELGDTWTEEGVVLAIIDQHAALIGLLDGNGLTGQEREVPMDLLFQPKN